MGRLEIRTRVAAVGQVVGGKGEGEVAADADGDEASGGE